MAFTGRGSREGPALYEIVRSQPIRRLAGHPHRRAGIAVPRRNHVRRLRRGYSGPGRPWRRTRSPPSRRRCCSCSPRNRARQCVIEVRAENTGDDGRRLFRVRCRHANLIHAAAGPGAGRNHDPASSLPCRGATHSDPRNMHARERIIRSRHARYAEPVVKRSSACERVDGRAVCNRRSVGWRSGAAVVLRGNRWSWSSRR